MTHTSTEQPEASEQRLQELRSYRITVENREARIAELEAEIERLRKLHKDAYQRGRQAGSMGLREAYDAVQEVKRQDAWGNAQLTEALIAAEARIAELEAQLIAEAARTAEQKLRADQLEQQHAMQAKMHAQAAEQWAAAQQPVEVTDDMALAFHQALTDGALGADELEGIKTGLRAALSHVQPLQKTVAASACSGCCSCKKQCQSKDGQAKAATVIEAAQQSVQDAEPAAWVTTFKPEGLLALHSVVGADLEELKQSVPGNSVFRPLYTHPTTQGLEQLIEQAGDVHFQRCRLGSIKGPIRWDVSFGHHGIEVRGKTLQEAIAKALAAQAKQGGV